jgi:hypothetical protein
MARIRFTDPALQAVYACLSPQGVDGPGDTVAPLHPFG